VCGFGLMRQVGQIGIERLNSTAARLGERATLKHELRLIEKLQYAPYFLTVNSTVRFARSKDILCQALIGGQLGGLLCPGHHLDRPRAQ
jgi:DNA polymerase III alpha subunit